MPFLNDQQKKISAIALLALSCLAALGYAIYYRWKMAKKIDPTLENSQNPPLNSLVNNPLNKTVNDPLNVPVNNSPKISDIVLSQEYQKGIVDFSFEVLQKKIKESDTENQLISPLGISFLMSMIRHGLSEEDQEEMARVIHLPKNSDEMKTSASKLMQKLIDSGLDIAGLLYINSRYRLNPDYQQLMSDHYKSHAESGSSADDVNGWVQKATHGQIQKIIEQDDLEDFVLLLANAIHFKASWAEKFKEKDTRLDDFVTPTSVILSKDHPFSAAAH